MAFQPEVGQELAIDGVVYRIAVHPAAPGIPYGQEGRQAIVYQVLSTSGPKALKVFKARYPAPEMAGLARRLAAFAGLPGLQVCLRTVLTPQAQPDLLRTYPDLTYSVLMPWVEGPTWMEILFDRQVLEPEQSLVLARSFAEMLSVMEQEGLAHCDISGPNVLLPMLAGKPLPAGASPVALVDLEQMYGPELRRPEFLAAGSPGYAHGTAAEGLWSRDADRFAGAVLMAEMLGWCDERVRRSAWGESYFKPDEMQQPDSERHLLMAHALEQRWGAGVARLYERAWTAPTLSACPTFGEWLATLPEPEQQAAGAAQTYEQALGEARRLEAQGDRAGALESYRWAHTLAPAGSAIARELSLIVQAMEATEQPVAPSEAADQATQPATPAPPAPPPPVAAPPPPGQSISSAGPTRSAQIPTAPPVSPGPTANDIGLTQRPPARRSSTRWYLLAIPAAVLVLAVVFGVMALASGGAKSPSTGQGNGGTGNGQVSVPMTMTTSVSDSPSLGLVRFADTGGGALNQMTVLSNAMPQPQKGTQYEVWLLGSGGEKRISLGVLKLDSSGKGDLDYTDKQNANLLSIYDAFEITAEPSPDTNPNPNGPVVYSGTLPPAAIEHVRHLIVKYPGNPADTAFTIGLVRTAEQVYAAAQAMQEGQQQGDLAKMTTNAEALVNIIEGKNGEHKDVNGDGKVSTLGDGFGMLVNGDNTGYIQGTIDHATLAMKAADASQNVKIHGQHVVICANNVSGWAGQLRDIALKIAAAKSADAEADDVKQALSLADRILNGKDLDGDESVDPVEGEGGALTAYQHAHYMADMAIKAPAGTPSPGGNTTP